MNAMPRRRPPNLHKETTRHGLTVWYVRKGRGPRIRIRAAFGTKEFSQQYEAAMRGEIAPRRAADRAGALAWLIARYRESRAWTKLAPATRDQRENILVHVERGAGHESFAAIGRKSITKGMDDRQATPHQANNFLKTMRGLFRWAVKEEYLVADPTEGVPLLTVKSDGFHTWSDAEIDKFEARWEIGTRERLAMTILLYTGLRRGDASQLGPQHVRDGVIHLKTEKTGSEVSIPILPELQTIIDATPHSPRAFIATPRGGPMVKEAFGGWFKLACIAAGVPGTAHGLRKAGATRAAENGATVAELEAIFGWHGGGMAALYTRKANRKKLAGGAIGKLSKK
jgi:integrase